MNKNKFRTCLITGGKGSMAQAIAKLLAKKGYQVFAPSHQELDVTKEKQVKNYTKKIKPNILINNAGYIVPNILKNTSYKSWLKHMDINCNGVFLCSKYTILNGCDTIITIGSTSAFGGRKEWGSYCAGKCAVLSITETLAEEGIKAYTLNPGKTKSKMRIPLFPKEDQSSLMKPERVARFILKILKGNFSNGSHIILRKDRYYVLPKRECPK